eukprot:gnl/Spiro4/14574_TR7855_c0_g1_i1.p2 gnl/Spiro4/14574_TR7855_c0_g1~~gnl/Spiro4/14574_TR7855_c0_g1_i1.p2  ORF type:complete len:217 (-),score=48.80 gnl/Spiro4/14574_TR7855_c0_g1_i1:130-747(-)
MAAKAAKAVAQTKLEPEQVKQVLNQLQKVYADPDPTYRRIAKLGEYVRMQSTAEISNAIRLMGKQKLETGSDMYDLHLQVKRLYGRTFMASLGERLARIPCDVKQASGQLMQLPSWSVRDFSQFMNLAGLCALWGYASFVLFRGGWRPRRVQHERGYIARHNWVRSKARAYDFEFAERYPVAKGGVHAWMAGFSNRGGFENRVSR